MDSATRRRRAGRRTNLGLLGLLALAFLSGVVAFAIGTLPAATVVAVSGAPVRLVARMQ